MSSGKPKLDVITISAKFCGFTNTTFNKMFIEHCANGPGGTEINWIPAEIEVNKVGLRKYLKKLPKGTHLEVSLQRKAGGYGTAAELIKAKKVKPKP